MAYDFVLCTDEVGLDEGQNVDVGTSALADQGGPKKTISSCFPGLRRVIVPVLCLGKP